MEWPSETQDPRLGKPANEALAARFRARASRASPLPRDSSAAPTSSSVGARIAAARCTPGRSAEMNGPSRWIPSTPGFVLMASRTAAIAARIFSGASVISVGNRPVVPKRRCAAAIAATVFGEGSSLNSASPPPLTWTSMKPGASQAPAGSRSTGHPCGRRPSRQNRCDAAVLDDHGMVVPDGVAVEQVVCLHGLGQGGHRVRVTLFR